MKAKFLVPLGLFVVLVMFLAVGLGLDPRDVPSPLVNKPAPAFKISQLSNLNCSFHPKTSKARSGCLTYGRRGVWLAARSIQC